MLSVSRYSSNRRVYRCGDRIYKIRRVASELYERRQDLAGEHAILLKLQGARGVCRDVEFDAQQQWEVLSYDYVPGRPLLDVIRDAAGLLTWPMIWRIFRALWSVHRRGVAHRDIRFDNVLLHPSGEVFLMDFDQAMEMPPAWAHLVDFFGAKYDGQSAIHCLERTVRANYRPWYLLVYPFVRTKRALCRLAGWLVRRDEEPQVQEEPAPAGPEIELLRQAWRIAQASDANAPGQSVAYYSLDVDGHHFYGERPWAMRWEQISDHVNFRGKSILELGCNLGLFSAFASRGGAARCLAVDANERILQGARMVAQAFGASVEHRRVDLDSPADWEQQLTGHDMVIAMSVANWVKDRRRLLRFLGRHKELIYEGHDSLQEEIHQLRSVGFGRIELLGISERGRAIYHARHSGRLR